MIFSPRSSRVLRGPSRRANGIIGARCGLLAHYYDLTLGTVQVQAQTVNSSAYNAIQASAWNWVSYDKVCQSTNTVAVAGGGLVSKGLGYGTLVTPVPNTAPLICTAFLVDSAAPVPTGG